MRKRRRRRLLFPSFLSYSNTYILAFLELGIYIPAFLELGKAHVADLLYGIFSTGV